MRTLYDLNKSPQDCPKLFLDIADKYNKLLG